MKTLKQIYQDKYDNEMKQWDNAGEEYLTGASVNKQICKNTEDGTILHKPVLYYPQFNEQTNYNTEQIMLMLSKLLNKKKQTN